MHVYIDWTAAAAAVFDDDFLPVCSRRRTPHTKIRARRERTGGSDDGVVGDVPSRVILKIRRFRRKRSVFVDGGVEKYCPTGSSVFVGSVVRD